MHAIAQLEILTRLEADVRTFKIAWAFLVWSITFRSLKWHDTVFPEIECWMLTRLPHLTWSHPDRFKLPFSHDVLFASLRKVSCFTNKNDLVSVLSTSDAMRRTSWPGRLKNTQMRLFYISMSDPWNYSPGFWYSFVLLEKLTLFCVIHVYLLSYT